MQTTQTLKESDSNQESQQNNKNVQKVSRTSRRTKEYSSEQIFKGNRTISDSSYSISSNDVAQFSYHNTEENFEMYDLDS